MAKDPDFFTSLLLEECGEDMAFEVLREVQAGHVVQQVLAESRQALVAQANERIERRVVEGLGQHIMSIDSIAYHYWGGRLGYECWGDEEFRREYMRDNPSVRVKTEFAARSSGWRPERQKT